MSDLVCECGKELEKKSAYLSHIKFCDETDVESQKNFECVCGESFQGKGALKSHRLWCDETDEEAPEYSHETTECPECGDEVAKSALDKHKGSKTCEAGGTMKTIKEKSLWGKYNDKDITIKNEWKVGEDKYKCPECGEVFSKKGIGGHIWMKHTDEGESYIDEYLGDPVLDENGKPYFCGWNKGLTKEDHKGIRETAETLSKKYRENPEEHPWYGKSHTEEFKEWKSQQMSEFYEENPEKHPNRVLAGNRAEMTYPEKLVSEKLEELDIKFGHNKKILKYYPDFFLENYDVIIEVDGGRWHSSEEQKEYDRKRDNELEEEGYEVYRIEAKDVLDNLKSKLEEIK